MAKQKSNEEYKKEKKSPMMEHYDKIKAAHPDCIIFYRLGDFYEMFFDDAIKASKMLDLTLTGRDCGMAERVTKNIKKKKNLR